MASKSSSFWIFIIILVLIHLILRLALGLTLIPDLITVAVLLGGRRLGGWQAALFGLVMGILADSLAITGFGATSVAYVVVAYLGARSRNLFEGDSYLFVGFYAFVGAWFIEAIRYVVGGAMSRGVEATYLVSPALLNSLYIALAAVVSLIAYRALSGNR